MVLSFFCGVLFGLLPAIESTRLDLVPALKKARWGGPRRRAQHLLVIAQVAASFLLLAVAGLFMRTVNQLHSVHLGYTRENILLFSCNAHSVGHREPEIDTFYENLRKRLESIPGVRAATLSQSSIIGAGLAGDSYRGTIKIDTATVRDAGVMVVGPHYFSTMQIPILAGREIDEHDQAGFAPVVVISKRLGRKCFGNESPLGRRITFADDNRDLQIVGVSGDVRYGDLKEDGSPMAVFVAARQFHPDQVTFALRTAGDPLGYVRTVYEIVRQADPRIPLTNVLTQAAEIDRAISQEITFARLCTGFAVLALLIACVGLYGTLSYGVARQGGEIGIRVALGAQRRAVVWMVLHQALLLAGIGLAIGVPAGLSASRLLRSFLFETAPNDPTALALAGIVLLSAAMLAGYAPAIRASRIDPMIALRQE